MIALGTSYCTLGLHHVKYKNKGLRRFCTHFDLRETPFLGRMAEVWQTRQHWTLVGASAFVGSTPTAAISTIISAVQVSLQHRTRADSLS